MRGMQGDLSGLTPRDQMENPDVLEIFSGNDVHLHMSPSPLHCNSVKVPGTFQHNPGMVVVAVWSVLVKNRN